MLLISNIGATKAIAFGGGHIPTIGSVITDGGAFLFPLTYVFGDVLAEVYGWRRLAGRSSSDSCCRRSHR